jgi:hypothetical protein
MKAVSTPHLRNSRPAWPPRVILVADETPNCSRLSKPLLIARREKWLCHLFHERPLQRRKSEQPGERSLP